MPEFENDFEGTEEAEVATQPMTEAVVETIAETMEAEVSEAPVAVVVADASVIEDEAEDEVIAVVEDEDDFFAENEAEQVPDVDPATIVTVRTSQGSDVYVPAPASMPLVDVIAKSGLRFSGDFTCWLNGQEVGLGTVVSGGQTVTVVGSVKGGVK